MNHRATITLAATIAFATISVLQFFSPPAFSAAVAKAKAVGTPASTAPAADSGHAIRITSLADLQEFFRYAPDKDIVISGHRGGMLPGYPENSIEAFKKTLSLLPAYFEIDMRLTKDGVIVLMHDATIDRTTTGKGKVSDYTYAELQKFFLKDRHGNVTTCKIPTLEEVLEWGAGKTIFQLDNKAVPRQVFSDNLKGKWAKYHNLLIYAHTPEAVRFYYERNNDNVMFVCGIFTMKQYEAFRDSGIPCNRIIGFVGKTMDPEQQKVHDLLRGHGVKCMIAIAPGADKITPDAARIEAYKKELSSNPDIIETDFPASFVDLPRKRSKK